MLHAWVVPRDARIGGDGDRVTGKVDPAPNDLINPRKLMMDRIDLWAASIRRGSLTLDRLGYTGKLVPVLVFKRIRVYLACNRAVPDALVARMNGSLEAMERDGTTRAIVHTYDDWGDAAALAGVIIQSAGARIDRGMENT